MKHKIIIGAASVALFGASALAFPQAEKPKGDKPTPRAEQPTMAANTGASCCKASTLIGAKVKNGQQADIGKVEDLVVDPSSGRIDYAVLSLTSRNEKGQWYAVPFQLLAAPKAMDSGKPIEAGSPGAGDRTPAGEHGGMKAGAAPEFTLNVDTTKLASAPGFSKDKWPDVDAPAWRTELDKHYGAKRNAAPTQNGDVIGSVRAIRVSELLDRSVETTDNTKLGEIEELAIDSTNARIAYFVVSTGGFLGLGDKMHAIPWEAIKVSPGAAGTKSNEDKLIVSLTKERLMKAPEFKKEDWAQMSDRAWLTDLYGYYGYRPYWSASSDMKSRDQKSGTPPAGKDKESREKGENDPH